MATKKRKINRQKMDIDGLPNDVFNKIFEYLGIRTFMTCRLVNKRWKSSIDEFKNWYKVKELVISNDEDDFGLMETTFFYTNKPFYEENLFRNTDLKLIKDIPLKLNGLTRLKLDGVLINRWGGKTKVDLSILNSLTSLEHLELPLVNPKDTTLSLPLLRIFYIYSTGGRSGLIIHCPKLEIIGCQQDLGSIYFVHIASIKQLHLASVPRNLEGFKNVEVFRTSHPHSLPVRILVQLRNLRELHLDVNKHVHVSYFEARKHINRLIEQKRKMKKKHLRIYFFNQLIDEGKTVGDYKIYRSFPNEFDDVMDGDDTEAYDSNE